MAQGVTSGTLVDGPKIFAAASLQSRQVHVLYRIQVWNVYLVVRKARCICTISLLSSGVRHECDKLFTGTSLSYEAAHTQISRSSIMSVGVQCHDGTLPAQDTV